MEEVRWVGHCFELQVVARWVLEEHRELLARQPREPQVWLNDEFHVALLQSFAEGVELFHGQDHTEVGNWHIMHIHVIAVLLRFEVLANEADPQQMIVELILYGAATATDFFRPDDLLVELMRDLQRIGRNRNLKFADTHPPSPSNKNDIKNNNQAKEAIFLR